MTAQQILSTITDIGIVPVVRTPTAEAALRSVDAIFRGGVRAAEVTMTVPGALKALEKLADQFGDKIILGAGTVLDPETARSCMLAGAQFFVTFAAQPALDGQSCVIGALAGEASFATLDRLEAVAVEGKRFRPVEDVLITRVTVHSNPLAER